MIYYDGTHIISDTSEEELHDFCKKVGIDRCWFHTTSSYPHYDLPKKRRKKTLQGATLVTPRQIVSILNSRGFGVRGGKGAIPCQNKRCEHPQGWHRHGTGSCLECFCLEYQHDDPGSVRKAVADGEG